MVFPEPTSSLQNNQRFTAGCILLKYINPYCRLVQPIVYAGIFNRLFCVKDYKIILVRNSQLCQHDRLEDFVSNIKWSIKSRDCSSLMCKRLRVHAGLILCLKSTDHTSLHYTRNFSYINSQCNTFEIECLFVTSIPILQNEDSFMVNHELDLKNEFIICIILFPLFKSKL